MKFNFLSESDQAYFIHKASTLVEALPYIREHSGKNIVIKYGGHAMGDRKLADSFSKDIGLLKEVGINPIVVHGGGPQIGQLLKKKKIDSNFVEGLRVTDKETVKVVEEVLANDINNKIVEDINLSGGKAKGFVGNQNNLITIGSSDAEIKIKIFSSLTCPHCANFHKEVVPEIMKEFVNTGKVQLIFIDFPLDQAAFNASKLLHCIDKKHQIRFLDEIYEKQNIWTLGSTIEDINGNLKKIVEDLGITSLKFDKCLIDEGISDKILNGRIKIIGVGGVDSGKGAYKKFLAGANCIQLYTGMIYRGPNIVNMIKKELKELLLKDGVKNFSEIIGKKRIT